MKLLQFTASWCAPCKGMKPMVDKVVGTVGVEFERIDIEESPDIATKYSVRGLPTFIMVSGDGEILGKKMGACSITQLMEFVKNPS